MRLYLPGYSYIAGGYCGREAFIQRLLAQFSPEEIKTGIAQRRKKTPHHSKAVSGEDVWRQSEEARLKHFAPCVPSEALLAQTQGISTARVGQIEQGDARLELHSIVGQVAALGYEVRITFTPAGSGGKTIEAQTIPQ